MRWAHPAHGLLYPDTFLPLAEQTGLMRQLTLVVLQTALRQGRAWRDAELARLGCDVVQGYHISKPLPAERLTGWLRHRIQPQPEVASIMGTISHAPGARRRAPTAPREWP